MASLAATVWPEPLSVVPCLSWCTASTVFTSGVMSRAMPWKLLEQQFFEYNYGDIHVRAVDEHLNVCT
jgi:hypothetical protein